MSNSNPTAQTGPVEIIAEWEGPAIPVPLQGHPMLTALLEQVSRLRKELAGWAEGHLVPVLADVHTSASEAQIATALANVRRVLRERAKIANESWLSDIANFGAGEYVGDPHAMTSAGEYRERVELSQAPIKNRTIVEQARQLRCFLAPAATRKENGSAPPPQSKPDVK